MDICLVSPKGLINIGSIARLLANFPLGDLIIVNPPKDYKGAIVKKYALKAYDIIENSKTYNDLSQIKEKYDIIIGTTARTGGEKHFLRKPLPLEKAIKKALSTTSLIVFGPEDRGLSNEELKYCDVVTTIPTSQRYRSMNLSHAVAVVLFYAWYININTKHNKKESSNINEQKLRKLLDLIDEIIDLLEFPRGRGKTTPRYLWRNIFIRAELTENDIRNLFGFFRRIETALKKK